MLIVLMGNCEKRLPKCIQGPPRYRNKIMVVQIPSYLYFLQFISRSGMNTRQRNTTLQREKCYRNNCPRNNSRNNVFILAKMYSCGRGAVTWILDRNTTLQREKCYRNTCPRKKYFSVYLEINREPMYLKQFLHTRNSVLILVMMFFRNNTRNNVFIPATMSSN